VKFDYPFIESIRSLLPICDEIVVAVGLSEDNTFEQIKSLNSLKINLIETVWDELLREGGRILSQQTNLALDKVVGDWAIYLQADEILHEKDYPAIRRAMEQYINSAEVEGFLFNYKHFYGSYDYIGDSRRWYRHEIRVIRPCKNVRSWGDAQGFRINDRKLRVKPIDASIFHYGWVKRPDIQQMKQRTFNKYWHSDNWVRNHIGTSNEYIYGRNEILKIFTGTHPSVMLDRISKQNWVFDYNSKTSRLTLKNRILDAVENTTGYRIGEYKNYKLI
jgi:hypothetical protein